MSEPFIGEIRIFSFNWAPRGWGLCDGSILQIRQYNALYSLLGYAFGGDGINTFGLPDLRGRTSVYSGSYQRGMKGGLETVTLNNNETAHTHVLLASPDQGDQFSTKPNNKLILLAKAATENTYSNPNNLVNMDIQTCSSIGGGQSHNNLQPSIVVNFCIALSGIYPTRN